LAESEKRLSQTLDSLMNDINNYAVEPEANEVQQQFQAQLRRQSQEKNELVQQLLQENITLKEENANLKGEVENTKQT
jgi:hypothetical protein